MAKESINIGTVANDGTGDRIRVGFTKTNNNFTELYNTNSTQNNSINAAFIRANNSLDANVGGVITGNVTVTQNLTVTGNISGNYFIGNGSQLTNISTSFDLEMHVSKDGNDSTGTGTILRPYLTITHALTQVTGGRNTIVIHPGGYTENPTITSLATQLITYDATGASTLVYGTVTIANTTGRIAGLKMTNLAITGNAQAYINSSTVDEQFTKSSSGYVEVDDCELQVTGNVLISGSGIITIIGNKINNLVVNNAGASVLVKGANDCLMPQVTAGSLNIVDSTIRASSNTANAVTASVGTVVTLMNNQIVTPTADNVARVSIAGYHSIISVVYDKANSTLSNSLNSVAYFQTANADKVTLSSGGSLVFPDSTIQITAAAPYAYSNAAFAVANNEAGVNATQNNSIGAAFNIANSAAVYSNTVDATQNTNISYIWNYANAAFSYANTISGGSSIDNVARVAAETANNTGTSAGIYANGAFAAANNEAGVNATQNTNITTAQNTATAAFIRANNSLNANTGGEISGNLLPTTTNTYYLGSDANRWHSLYVGPGSIDLGGLVLSNQNGTLAVSVGGQAPTEISGSDQVARNTANAAFNTANAAFNTANIANTRTIINGLGNSKLDFNTYGANSAYLTTTSDDSTALFMGTATAELYANTNIQIRANTGGTSKAWTFGEGGTLTFPDSTIQTTAYVPGDEIDPYARNHANAAFASANNVAPQIEPAFTTANGAFAKANNEAGVNATQNNQITILQNTTQAAFNAANNVAPQIEPAFTTANGAFAKANNEAGVNATQNTNITNAQNTGDAAFLKANNEAGVNATQNTNITNAQNTGDAAFAKANNEAGVNATQNTNITNAQNTATAAFIRANNSLNANNGGTITGDLSITGNLSVLGNSFTISATNLVANDTLILLGSGNYTADLLDIGISAHYNDGVNAHTGLIRDHGTKEWQLFEGYIPEIGANNDININDPSFKKATLNANLKSQSITLNNQNLQTYIDNSYNKANAAFDSANNIDNINTTQNNSITAAFTAANNEAGVNATQNTNITIAQNTADAAFLAANNAGGADQVARDTANAAFLTANTANNTANIAYRTNFISATRQRLVVLPDFASSPRYRFPDIAGPTANSPTLSVIAGQTYAFDLSSMEGSGFGGFKLYTASPFASGSALSGVTHVSSSGVVTSNATSGHTNGTLYWTAPTSLVGNTTLGYGDTTYNGIFGSIRVYRADDIAAAFNAANNATSAGSYANSAFITANTAGIYANGAFVAANSAGVYANGAFTAANAATTTNITQNNSITAAFAAANTADTKATSAGIYANGAFITANTADTKATSAGIYANGAFTAANAVSANATSAGIYANGAFTAANAATTTNITQNNSITAAFAAANAATTTNITQNNSITAAFAAANAVSANATSAGVYANGAFTAANAAAAAASSGSGGPQRQMWGIGGDTGYGAFQGQNTVTKSSPVQLTIDATNWKKLASSPNYALVGTGSAIKTDGTLWSWGDGTGGTLGNGLAVFRSSPTQVLGGGNWRTVTKGYSHTIALKIDGTLWGWGTQRNGELGLDGAFNAAFSSPVQIGTSNNWLDVASSLTSVLALKDNGSLWAWGKNAVAQLGLNDTVNRSSPTQVGSFGSWRKIFVDTIDNGGAAAIKNDGTLWCWGGNGYGKLGINRGAAARASSPTQVGLDTNWKSIRITIRNVYYVKTDGTLWITGSGFDGQFGNNTAGAFAGDRSSPVQLGTDTNWHQVYGPAQTCVAIKNDGTLWAWGANTASPGGILGWTVDGISIQRSSPIQVAYVGPYNRWVDIANQGTAIALIRKTNIDPEDNSLPQQY